MYITCIYRYAPRREGDCGWKILRSIFFCTLSNDLMAATAVVQYCNAVYASTAVVHRRVKSRENAAVPLLCVLGTILGTSMMCFHLTETRRENYDTCMITIFYLCAVSTEVFGVWRGPLKLIFRSFGGVGGRALTLAPDTRAVPCNHLRCQLLN